jgi:hypothetical protein
VIDKCLFARSELFLFRARVTARRRAGREAKALPRSLHHRASFAAPVPFRPAGIPTGHEAGVGGLGLLDPPALLIAMALDIVGMSRALLATLGPVPRFQFQIAQLSRVQRRSGHA